MSKARDASGTSQVIVAQLGARMHYAVPRLCEENGMLAHFYTDICATMGWPRLLQATPSRFRPPGLRRLLGRVPTGVPKSKTTSFTRLGWKYVRERQRCKTQTERTKIDLKVGSDFCRHVASRGFDGATAVYGFNTASLELMQAARGFGVKAIVEQAIAPYETLQSILKEEMNRHPEWPREGDDDAADERIARERAEWNAADLIICGSSYVKDRIGDVGGPTERCVVVPYGIDASRFRPMRRQRPKGCLRVLTVGTLGLRKGTPYIFEAARQMVGKATFRLAGSGEVPDKVRSHLPENVELLGQVPRSDIRGQFEWADIFLLPSLCEGSATVTYEAMLSGLPVVCTPNTGSIIVDGQSGIIIPPQEPSAIVSALLKAGDELETLSNNAIRESDCATYAGYSVRLASVLRSQLQILNGPAGSTTVSGS